MKGQAEAEQRQHQHRTMGLMCCCSWLPPPPSPLSISTNAATTGYSSAATPFYRDPLFDGAHDAELVWHEGEQSWWLTYLQNRYRSCAGSSLSLGSTTGTDLGLASSPDGGKTWIYRGVMGGLDVPAKDMRARCGRAVTSSAGPTCRTQ